MATTGWRQPADFAARPPPEPARRIRSRPASPPKQVPMLIGSPQEMKVLMSVFGKVCTWAGNKREAVRFLTHEKREELIRMLTPFVETEPRGRLGSSSAVVDADCEHHDWYPELFTGERRATVPLMLDVISGMGGGAELDLLEIRLYELEYVVDFFVVSESDFNFRGDRKPRHFKRSEKRFSKFAERIVYLDLDTCKMYRAAVDSFRNMGSGVRPHDVWNVQNAQRICVWSLLEEEKKDLDDNTLVIFSDLDEIPRAAAMSAIKHCEPAPKSSHVDPSIMNLHLTHLRYNLRAANGCDDSPTPDDWVQGVVIVMESARDHVLKDGRVHLSYRESDVRNVRKAGVHLSYFGNLGQVLYKIIQHGEGGDFLGLETKSCELAFDVDKVQAVVRQLMNDPVSLVRWWEKRSKIVPKEVPSINMLEQCSVPAAILDHPERYPWFLGGARMEKRFSSRA